MKYDKQSLSLRWEVFFFLFSVDEEGVGVFVRKSDDWLQHCKMTHLKIKSLLRLSSIVFLSFLLMQTHDFKFSV